MRLVFLALAVCLTAAPAAAQPPAFALDQNDPNPFCPGSDPTRIHFAIAVPCTVTLVVRDPTTLQTVRLLVDGIVQTGLFVVVWDGRDDHGALVPDGLYPYEMLARIGDVTVFQATRTAEAACLVAVEPATWGRIKRLYAPGSD